MQDEYLWVQSQAERLISANSNFIDRHYIAFSKLTQLLIPEDCDKLNNLAYSGLKLISDKSFGDLSANHVSLFKIILNFDGSLPSYPVLNGLPYTSVFEDSPAKTLTDSRAESLKTAIKATGKITLFDKIVGTGFLVGPNIVMTNRHVAQLLAQETKSGWNFISDSFVDFEGETDNTITKLCKITKILYTPSARINSQKIDHNKLDIAFLQIHTVDNMPEPVNFNTSCGLDNGDDIFAIGFPVQQYKAHDAADFLQKFFNRYLGSKKVAPGKIINCDCSYPGRKCHSASTLAGNSGSLIVKSNSESITAAIHYGGCMQPVKENWCHDIAYFLNDATSAEIRKIIADTGCKIVSL
ncbi:MAG: S1 family peptidase [Flavobacterium sp.]